MFGPVERIFAIEERDITGPGGDLRVRIYRPDGGVRLPVMVYFHGGGWVVGGLDSHDGVTRHLCAHGRCMVVAVDYRLAPEHRFPDALEDAWAATVFVHEHLAELGGDASRLVVGGDSAGGNLAAVVAMRARDAHLPLKLQLLVYPVLDCSGLAAGTGDEAYGWWVQRYLRDASDGLNPDASPLLAADLRGLAPAVILSCDEDILRHEAAAYERRLRDAGVAVDHIHYSGLIHGAYRMPAVLDDARKMLDDSVAALVRTLAVQ
jgi:acetyl esterase